MDLLIGAVLIAAGSVAMSIIFYRRERKLERARQKAA
jgi:hypothetical protein